MYEKNKNTKKTKFPICNMQMYIPDWFDGLPCGVFGVPKFLLQENFVNLRKIRF